MKPRTSITLISIMLVCVTSPLHAEEQGGVHPYLDQNFFVDLGMYFPDREVTLSVNGTVLGPADRIDFDEQFGLKKSDETFALNFGWRFGEKWQLGGQYFEASGKVRSALTEDVEWNDVVFGEGTGVAVGQEFSLLRVFFARRFKSSENSEFGLGAGIHWLEIGAFIEGNATINGVDLGFRKESVSADAPLPNIGIWYTHSFSPKWAFKGRYDWLSAKVGDYDGTLINASLGVNYQMFEHVGLGLSYNIFTLDVNVRKNDWKGNFETAYKGPYLNMSFYW